MTHVELRFPVQGTTLPTQQGYALYSAISRLIPEVHESDWFAMETLPGIARGDGTTQLDSKARLKLRVPPDRVPLVLPLAGKRLALGAHSIRLGAPQIFLLQPSPALHARIVTIKHHTEPDSFLKAVFEKLDVLGITGEPIIGARRVVKIANHTVVGFGLTLHELSDEGSLLLQERGLGGRRHMGCGFFNPVRSIQVLVGKPRPLITQE